jgi:metal-responsive CopG/Arc/MetJ family transcriptional regulator
MPTVKTAISLEQDLFKRTDEFAFSAKTSRSRVIALALEEYLRRQENLALLEKINASYGDAPDPEEDVCLRSARHSHRKLVDEW